MTPTVCTAPRCGHLVETRLGNEIDSLCLKGMDRTVACGWHTKHTPAGHAMASRGAVRPLGEKP